MASAKASIPVMGDASVPWVSDDYNSIFLCSYCGFTELLAAEELVVVWRGWWNSSRDSDANTLV